MATLGRQELAEDVVLAKLCLKAQDPRSPLCFLGDVQQALRDSATVPLGCCETSVNCFSELQTEGEPALHGRVIMTRKDDTLVVVFATTWDERDELVTEPTKVYTDPDRRKPPMLCCSAANRVWQDVFLDTAMQLSKKAHDTESRDIVFAGQGVGGAVAAMFALSFAASIPVRKVVTFGSTPIGDESWNAEWIAKRVLLVRYVVQGDARTLATFPVLKHPRATVHALPKVQEHDADSFVREELNAFQDALQTTSHFLLKNVPLLRFVPELTQKVEDASFLAVPMSRYIQRLTNVLASRDLTKSPLRP